MVLRIYRMNEIIAQSREAREKLASALSILQAPEAGGLVDSVAGPVARAMGALHQIESSNGKQLAEKGPIALVAVREALAALQTSQSCDAADEATAIIAGSLGLIHGIAENAQASALPASPIAPAQTPQKPEPSKDQPKKVEQGRAQTTQERMEAFGVTQIAGTATATASASPQGGSPAPAAPSGGLDQTLPTPAAITPPTNTSSLGSTQASASVAPPAGKLVSSPAHVADMNRNSKRASAPPADLPDGVLQIEANLGAHSATNYYKGLSGNDVINDGGLFIATYDIPDLGTDIWVSVHMPGGYEFQALAIVAWTREAGAGDAPPGFGCTFKSVSDDARKLVQRYVRNREPLFHDDL